MYTIYKIVKENKILYIGKTVNFKRRKSSWVWILELTGVTHSVKAPDIDTLDILDFMSQKG